MPDDRIIFTADDIITMDDARPRVEAVAVADGRIVAVGSIAECRLACPDSVTRELVGSVVMPGFVEPHSHPLLSGMSTEAPAYYIAPWLVPSWAGILDVAEKAKAEVPQGNSIVLFGLDQLLHGCPFPTAREMDQIFGDRVATIIALSQHKAAVTTATLRELGWADEPPQDPVGGTFGRLPDGRLDGTADEVPAVLALIKPALASLGGHPLGQSASYLAGMSRVGITSVGDMAYDDTMQAPYEALCALAELPMRVSVYHSTSDPGCSKPLRTAVSPDVLMKGGLKFWADGSAWLGTIATSFPYLDSEAVRRAGITDLHPGPKAFNYDRTELDAMLDRHAGQGWQMACHANGDLTVDLVLDAYEAALTKHNLMGTDHRWRLEHVGAARTDQLARMSRLGVVPTFGVFQLMQWGDLLDGELYESRYGARWSPTGDAAGTDLDAVHQSYHNDGNISPSNPLASVQAAVTRRSNSVSDDGQYRFASGNLHGPEQQVSLHIALRAITINAAYILRRDHEVGSISVGKFADFVELSKDPYAVNPATICEDVTIRRTWLAGQPTDPDAFVAAARALDRHA
jgi:predicted amidohydrolase YtcJ